MLTYCGEQYCHLSVEYHCFPPAGEERDSCLSCFSVALMKYPEESDKKGWVHFGSGETASVVAGKHLASREGEEGAMVEAGGSCSHPGSPLPSGSRGEARIKPQARPPRSDLHPPSWLHHLQILQPPKQHHELGTKS